MAKFTLIDQLAPGDEIPDLLLRSGRQRKFLAPEV
jgi:hypothetical protein